MLIFSFAPLLKTAIQFLQPHKLINKYRRVLCTAENKILGFATKHDVLMLLFDCCSVFCYANYNKKNISLSMS